MPELVVCLESIHLYLYQISSDDARVAFKAIMSGILLTLSEYNYCVTSVAATIGCVDTIIMRIHPSWL